MNTVIEPFRTKMVEPIHFTSREQRAELLSEAGYNLFNLRASDVIIDLLTDSGTSAMSSNQWSALMRGDESYAGCDSFYRFQERVQEVFGFPEVIPVHQGRAAERILFGCLVKPGHVVPSNTHFDTTRANIERCGAEAIDLPVRGGCNSTEPFKGNIDLQAVTRLIADRGAESIPLGLLTLTNNSGGGQPASLENVRDYARLLSCWGIPFYIDAARFAENAWLVRQRDPSAENRPVREIVREIFDYADGCLMSAKKDGLANMGGFIALRDSGLAEQLKEALILTEGFPTYGGLSGRDLETIAVGLEEVLCEHYLRYREQWSSYLADGLLQAGIPIVQPAGLHAVYIDARRFLPHIPPYGYPGQVLATELYLEAGIRTCEIGTVMFGRPDPASKTDVPADHDLVRLALPRRVYSKSHYDYVVEAAANVFARRDNLVPFRIVSQPERLRHFTARFAPCAMPPGCLRNESPSAAAVP